ncbi:Uncharacterized protein APZ42_025068 [Daphnia magna]|uniref:Peptidase A2 domain-containing protein n=1 Tax=Daphnia magna TaxID=35525 RepID=A0A164THW1_9CRUS|nr:Uncharacterized protein APZ42_025068 [Daphnia magna]
MCVCPVNPGCIQHPGFLKILPVPLEGTFGPSNRSFSNSEIFFWTSSYSRIQPAELSLTRRYLKPSFVSRLFTYITRLGADAEEEKTKRTNLRREITVTSRQIESLTSSRGSRGDIQGFPLHLNDLLLRTSQLQTEISSIEAEEEEAERQDATHLTYITRAGELSPTAQDYLKNREEEAASIVELNVVPVQDPQVPPASPSEILRQQIDNTTPQVKALLDRQLQKNSDNNQETPDTWIDLYSAGRLPPTDAVRSPRPSVSAESEPFDGKALDWVSCIDLFRALVHDTPKSPEEKLTLLKRFLRGDCLDLVYGLGGGESAYIEALVRLKQTCSRRDVMRAAHHQAIQSLETKQDLASFKRFAERIRTHLFDLSKIGETGTADLTEKSCLKLQLPDRLAWNEERRGRIEDRSPNAFGMWLCSRSSAYQNAFSIADDQVNPTSSKPTNHRRQARTHQSSEKMSGEQKQVSFRLPGKPFFFKCEKKHRLSECEDFKLLSTGERLTFCMRRRLCFSCFSTKHSVRECDRRRPCKHSGCGYFHHPLLHDTDKKKPSTESEERARSTTARAGAERLPMMADDGSWVLANIFVDEGSDSTLMRSAFTTALKVRGPRHILAADVAGGIINRYPSARV